MIEISIKLFRNIFSSKNSVASQLKSAFNAIKLEFEDHLQSINENTNEIQSNYEYLCEIDAKIEKLSERMDEIQFMLQGRGEEKIHSVLPLTRREQEVFLTLYQNEKHPLTVFDIATRIALTESMVESYIESISAKGVPVVKELKEDGVWLSLDPGFRIAHAKNNIVKINESVVKEIIG